MKTEHRLFHHKLIYVAVSSCFLAYMPSAYAQNDSSAQVKQELETVHVKGKRKVSKRDNEVTGLGKVVKTAEQISKEQILDIRDLTRYDPGISVVEQGRGATSGYAMRGVDKNRVAMLVDGLPQVQSYSTLFSSANSGAINEIEYENVRSIELSKGSSSAEYGNGALGGAVGFRTKESGDIIKEGQNWGLDTKSAYSSKNNQLTNSVAFAGKWGGFDGLAVFTHRRGEETIPHSAAGSYQHSFERLSAFADEYDLRRNSTPDQKSSTWFVLKEECPTLQNCTPKAVAAPTRPADRLPTLRDNLTPNEQAQVGKMVHPTMQSNAKNYTGSQRILPNPMDYQSHSWLLKGGYRFSPEHYVGGVYEHTARQYDIRDMSLADYYLPSEEPKTSLTTPSRGMYLGNDPTAGLVFDRGEWSKYGLNYARTRFFDEHHSKTRYGVQYRYESLGKDGWADKLALSLDRQNIAIDSRLHEHRCSVYPAIDPNCRASLDKPWSHYLSERNRYSEQRDSLQLAWEKAFKWNKVHSKFNVLAGVERQNSTLQRSDYLQEFADVKWERVGTGGNGSYDSPRIYDKKVNMVISDKCDYTGEAKDLRDCTPRAIQGRNYFLALRHTAALGKWADLGLGLRYDYHRFNSKDSWTSTGSYRNWSWNGGLTIKPTDYLLLSYRLSNGFRVPAAYEMFGYRVQGKQNHADALKYHHVAKIQPEKSLNHELGIGFKGEFGSLEMSYFHNRYKNMIALAERRGLENNQFGYHNIQNVTLHGVNILGKIYWDGVWQRLPEGLYSTLAYNQVKVKKREINPNFTNTTDPVLEAVQPGRYTVSVGYDHPDGKWGVSFASTYSKAKSQDELSGVRHSGNTSYQLNTLRTNKWYTHDITGYLNIRKFLTLRAGIYNLANRKYSTWESVRQSSIVASNNPNVFNQQVGNGARYAAAGRNFILALEMKF